MSEPESTHPPDAAGRLGWRALTIALGLGIALYAGRDLGARLPEIAAWLDDLGPAGPAAFVAVYALATVALVPGSLLTLAGGAIFGLGWGTLWVFLGALLGSSAAFILARYAIRDLVARRLAGHPRLAAVDRAIAAQGRRVVFLLRLSPVFPFSLLNYFLGVTRIRFLDALMASPGMIPGTVLYVYYGKVLGDVAALAGGARSERGPFDYALLAVGLLATIGVTTIVTRLARRSLQESSDVR